MKGFEKWWRKKNKGNYECYSGVASEAWKAALKWVREEEKICGPLYIWIDEELDEN